jgi:hypothetical protein
MQAQAMGQLLEPAPGHQFLEECVIKAQQTPPEQRTAAIIGGALGFVLLLIGIVSLYFAASKSLQSELDAWQASVTRIPNTFGEWIADSNR